MTAVQAISYGLDARGSIILPAGPPFDGEPVLVKVAAGWCEARWEPGRVGQTPDGPDYDGFCWVLMDDALPCADIDEAKYWAPLPEVEA